MKSKIMLIMFFVLLSSANSNADDDLSDINLKLGAVIFKSQADSKKLLEEGEGLIRNKEFFEANKIRFLLENLKYNTLYDNEKCEFIFSLIQSESLRGEGKYAYIYEMSLWLQLVCNNLDSSNSEWDFERYTTKIFTKKKEEWEFYLICSYAFEIEFDPFLDQCNDIAGKYIRSSEFALNSSEVLFRVSAANHLLRKNSLKKGAVMYESLYHDIRVKGVVINELEHFVLDLISLKIESKLNRVELISKYKNYIRDYYIDSEKAGEKKYEEIFSITLNELKANLSEVAH